MEKIKSAFYSLIVPSVLVLINFALKIRYVTFPSLAKDEPFSVYYSQFDLTTIISELSQGNNPPLYEMFLHIWTSVFGISELSVRFPSVLFSSLTVYFIYQICRKFFNTKTAVLAALLFTLSNYQIYFAHEARVYPMFMLLTTISMYQFLKLISEQRSTKNVIIYLIINVFLLYSHFFSWFVILVQIIACISLYWNRREELMRFTKYYGITLLFYLPYLGVFINRFLDSSGGTWVEPVTNLRPLHSFYASLINNGHVSYVAILILAWIFLQRYISKHFKNTILRTGLILLSILFVLISLSIRLPIFQFENDFSSPLVVVTFLLFYLALFIYFQTNEKHSIQGKIVLSWFFIPCFTMFAASFSIPMFIDRYLIYFTPAFFIVLSVIISKIDKKLFLSISLLIITLMAVTFEPISNNQRDVKTLVHHVKEMRKNSNSVVFICPDYQGFAFTYYYNTDYFKDTESGVPLKDMKRALNSDDVFLVNNHREVDSIYTANDYGKIIFVDATIEFKNPENNIKNYLDSSFQNEIVAFDSIHVPRIFNIYSYQLKE